MNRSVSKPNLFTYATKELSQDAMICWLIKWSEVQADDECGQALRDLGRAFAGALLGKHHQSLAGNIKRVEIHQQDHGIDVLARIEDESTERVLLIEDKTGTSDHSGQLKRYRDAVKNGVTNLGNVSEHWPIYLKTGNQSRADDRRIENETGFKVFRREDFLMLLENYPVSNPIVTDFRKHLQEIEDDFNGFNDWKRDDRANWSWGAWEGFIDASKANWIPATDAGSDGVVSTIQQEVFSASGGGHQTAANCTFKSKAAPARRQNFASRWMLEKTTNNKKT